MKIRVFCVFWRIMIFPPCLDEFFESGTQNYVYKQLFRSWNATLTEKWGVEDEKLGSQTQKSPKLGVHQSEKKNPDRISNTCFTSETPQNKPHTQIFCILKYLRVVWGVRKKLGIRDRFDRVWWSILTKNIPWQDLSGPQMTFMKIRKLDLTPQPGHILSENRPSDHEKLITQAQKKFLYPILPICTLGNQK